MGRTQEMQPTQGKMQYLNKKRKSKTTCVEGEVPPTQASFFIDKRTEEGWQRYGKEVYFCNRGRCFRTREGDFRGMKLFSVFCKVQKGEL